MHAGIDAGVSRCCDAMPQVSIMRYARNRRDTTALRAPTHLWAPGLISLDNYTVTLITVAQSAGGICFIRTLG